MNLLLLFLLFCMGDVFLIVGLQLLIWAKLNKLYSYCMDNYCRDNNYRDNNKKQPAKTPKIQPSKPRKKPYKHFSPEQRELMILKTDSGMKPREIAESMGLKISQVYSYLHSQKHKRKNKR